MNFSWYVEYSRLAMLLYSIVQCKLCAMQLIEAESAG